MPRQAKLGKNDFFTDVKRIGTALASITGSAGPHNILSATHSDAATVAVSRGALIYGDATPEWELLAHPAAAGYALTTDANDVFWDQTPNWSGLHTFDGGWILGAGQTGDLNGQPDALVLDGDGDTTLSAPNDDQIDFEISGADDFTMTANSFNVLSGSAITMADDTWIGLDGAAGRLIFDSTPAPDEIRVSDANLDLNNNDLVLDTDGDSYLHASGDDIVELVLATASGEFDININGANDFTFTANAFNVAVGSSIVMGDGTTIGQAAGPLLTFDDTNNTLELSGGDLELYSGADLIIYSDAGATEVGRWDGATGDYTSSGNVTITQDGALAAFTAYSYGVSAANFPTFRGRAARTSLAAPSAVQDGDILCRVGGAGYGATGFAASNRSYIQCEASQTWTDANQGAEIYFYTTPNNTNTAVNRGVIAQDGRWGIGNLTAPSTLLHVYTSDSDTTVLIETDKADGQPALQFLNDARQWNIGINASDQLQIRDATAAANRIIIDTSGNVGIGTTPSSLLELNFATENLEFVDAGSAGATEQDWIEVAVGGNTGYIRVFAAV